MQQHRTDRILMDNEQRLMFSAPPECGVIFNRFQNHPDDRRDCNYDSRGHRDDPGPRANYWPHRHNSPYGRFEGGSLRPWRNNGNNMARPPFMMPGTWIRQRQQQPYRNVGLAFPPQMPVMPFRHHGPRYPYDSLTGPDRRPSALPSPIRHSHAEVVVRNLYHNLSPRASTLKLKEDDEEYRPEPVAQACIDFNSRLPSTSTGYGDSTRLSNSNSSLEDDYSNDSSSTLLLSPSPLLEKVLSLSDICQEEDSFLDIFIAASVKLVRNEEGRAEPTASFGVWLNKGSELNVAELLPKGRLQCLKAALIFGSGKVINLMKEKGHNRLKINMESDFLILNVSNWKGKFMDDACKGLELTNFSNWDEYKYAMEVQQLCRAFQGMIVKWSHVSSKLDGIKAAKTLAKDILISTSPLKLSMISYS